MFGWIERKKEEEEKKFENMKTMYHIPRRFKDASKALFGVARKDLPKAARAIPDSWEPLYEEMQYKIPKDIGQELELAFEDEDYFFGIHRTDWGINDVSKFFTQGLSNRSNEITSTVQQMKYLPLMIREICNCFHYKMSQGCILVKIPKKINLPIYYRGGKNNSFQGKSETTPYLLPEYIYGYIAVDIETHTPTKFIKNPSYSEEHNYDPAGLEYDENLQTEQYLAMLQEKRNKSY